MSVALAEVMEEQVTGVKTADVLDLIDAVDIPNVGRLALYRGKWEGDQRPVVMREPNGLILRGNTEGCVAEVTGHTEPVSILLRDERSDGAATYFTSCKSPKHMTLDDSWAERDTANVESIKPGGQDVIHVGADETCQVSFLGANVTMDIRVVGTPEAIMQ